MGYIGFIAIWQINQPRVNKNEKKSIQISC